jgi:hypothetical protein
LSDPNFDSFRPARARVAAAAALAATAIVALLASSALAGGGGLSAGSGSSGGSDKSQPSPLNQGPAKYDRMWKKATRREKRWASRTSECESGKNPDAIGGGGTYRGAFQFMRSTWRSSPKSPGGDPTAWNYRTQAVVAVALKRRQGTSPWPVCG